ncbi:MAG: hypothetical protein K9M07_01700 [Simkaniaceae bacterium]|nr:hypothetical protein [Simkaniaceae bacterium]
MADPNRIPDYQGQRLPSEESRESEIDPEKFRKLTKVEEADEAPKKKKRAPAEEKLEEEEDKKDVEDGTAPARAFSSYMSDQRSDSDLNVQKPTGGIKRAPSSAPEGTQSYNLPKAPSSHFPGGKGGEELGDALFENLPEAPPEYSEEPQSPYIPPAPIKAGALPQAPEETEESPGPKLSFTPEGMPESKQQSFNQGKESSSHPVIKPQGIKNKKELEKGEKIEPLKLEAETKHPHLEKGKGEIPQGKLRSEAPPFPKQPTAIKETKAPFHADTEKSSVPQIAEEHELSKEKSFHEEKMPHPAEEPSKITLPFKEKEQQKPPYEVKAEKTSTTPTEGAVDEAAAAAAAKLTAQPPIAPAAEGALDIAAEKAQPLSKKRIISQPETPVIFSKEGKLETHLSRDKEEREDQQQDMPQTIQAISPTTTPMPIEAPAYSHLNPQVFDLFERMVGVLTIEMGKGVSTTTVTLNMPNSVFNGAKIVIDHYDIAPHSFNLLLQGSEQAVNMFNANLSDLAAAFQGSKLAFEVNIRRPELLPKHQTLFHRKSTDYSGGEGEPH